MMFFRALFTRCPPLYAVLCGVIISESLLLFAHVIPFVQMMHFLQALPSRVQAVFVLIPLLLLTLLAWFFCRFFICGLLLGILACAQLDKPLNLAHDCTFFAHISQADYQARRDKHYVLNAEKIQCSTSQQQNNLLIDNAKIRFIDYQNQLADYGDKRFIVHGQLKNRFTPQNPYRFDFNRYAFSQGLFYQLEHATFEVIGEADFFTRQRAKIATFIQHDFPKHQGFLIALLLGNKSALSPAQKQTMQGTGTQHLLAISGLHISLIGLFFAYLVLPIYATSFYLSARLSPFTFSVIISLLMMLLYALLSGFALPAQRAFFMALLAIMLFWCFKKPVRQVFFWVLLACLLWQPSALLSASFYLTFLATYCVILATRFQLPPLFSFMLMQIFLILGLLPLYWYVFGQIASSSFWVNLVAIPFLSVFILPLAFIYLLCVSVLAPLPPLLLTLLQSGLNPMLDIFWAFLHKARQHSHLIQFETSLSLWQSVLATLCLLASFTLCVKSYQKRGQQYLRGPRLAALVALPLLALLILNVQHLTRVLTRVYPQRGLLVLAYKRPTAIVFNGEQALLINPYSRRGVENVSLFKKWLKAHHKTVFAILLTESTPAYLAGAHAFLRDNPNIPLLLTRRNHKFNQAICQASQAAALSAFSLQFIATGQQTHCEVQFDIGVPVRIHDGVSPADLNLAPDTLTLNRENVLTLTDKTSIAGMHGAFSLHIIQKQPIIHYEYNANAIWQTAN